jgi:hypothetical protein
MAMLRAMHLIPIICLPDFGHYDEEYLNTVLNVFFLYKEGRPNFKEDVP